MIHSLEFRVARLEEMRLSRGPAARAAKARAERAVARGTATLQQYDLVGSERLDQGRTQYLARVPAIVAWEKAGMNVYGMDRALAYPPDRDLPQDLQDQLDSYIRAASTTLEEMRRNRKERRRDPMQVLVPEMRLARATPLVVLGGVRAQRLRKLVWRPVDGRWQISAEVMASAASTPIGPYGAKTLEQAPAPFESGTPGEAIPRYPGWGPDATWAEVAADLERSGYQGCNPHPWSDQVIPGHGEVTAAVVSAALARQARARRG